MKLECISEGVNMLDLRQRKARTKVTHPAKIRVRAATTYDCMVDDLNTRGASLSFGTATTAELPRTFDLTFDDCRTFWSCRVIWRSKNRYQIGVTWKNN